MIAASGCDVIHRPNETLRICARLWKAPEGATAARQSRTSDSFAICHPANTATSDAGHPRPVLGGIDCDGIRRSASPRELPPRDDRPKRAPPLTCRIWPVICPASGDAKYSIALATPQVLAPHIQTERWQRDCAAATHLCASGKARRGPPAPDLGQWPGLVPI
jgi:hypothetical protein